MSAMPDGMRQGILDAAVRELVGREDAAPGLRSLGSAVSAAKMVGSLRRLRADEVVFDPRVVSVVDSLVIEASPEFLSSRQRQNPEAVLGVGLGDAGVLAGDLLPHLPEALRTLRSPEREPDRTG